MVRRLSEALLISVNGGNGGDGAIEVTASIGVSVYPEDARDAASLLKAADKAMYVSKRSGRCRVTFFGQGRAEMVEDSLLSRKN